MMYDVLLVEDEPQFRQFINKVLSSKGFRVREAVDGKEAINLLSENNYKVVINDLRLPGLSGREITRFIHSTIDPETPVIIITGYEEEWPEIEATSEHVFYYMKKGQFSPDELVKVVKNAVSYREKTWKRMKNIKDAVELEKLEAIGKLAIGIAHEINNPLQGILSTIHNHLLQTKGEYFKTSEIKKDLEFIFKAINRIKNTIENLNSLYRSSRKIKMGPTVQSIIEYISSFCMPIAHEYRISFKSIRKNQKPPEDPDNSSVLCSSETFEILFHTTLNLLNNNVKSLTMIENIFEKEVRVDFICSIKNMVRFEDELLPWIEFTKTLSKKIRVTLDINAEGKNAVLRIFIPGHKK